MAVTMTLVFESGDTHFKTHYGSALFQHYAKHYFLCKKPKEIRTLHIELCSRVQIFKTKPLSHKPDRLNYKDLSNNGDYSKDHTQHNVWLNAAFFNIKVSGI
jgi:hypothetical protein